MPDMSPILHLHDDRGNPVGVQLSLELWRKLEPLARRLLESDSGEKRSAREDLAGFAEFLRYWDFRYNYNPAVECPNCHAVSGDWRADPAHPFHLHNANIGGLLVFRCANCGATIRHKYFRDHMAVEFSPPG